MSLDFASQPLWDQYIAFETSQEEFKNVNQIYCRLLQIPLEQIGTYWHRYKQFVAQQSVETVATEEELRQIYSYQDLSTDEKRKNWIIGQREIIYKKSHEEAEKRRALENEVLKISYFHVRPLTQQQLTAWSTYLTFEEKQGDHARIVNLYERCIIPCVRTLLFVV